MALVQANTSFFSGTDEVQMGEVFEDSHPIVRSTPAEWWNPLVIRGMVEEATAKPARKARLPKDDDETSS